MRSVSRLERRLAGLAFLVLTLAVGAQRLWPRLDEPLRVTLAAFGEGDGTDRMLPIDPWGRLAVPLPVRGEPPAARHLRAASLCFERSRQLTEVREDRAAVWARTVGVAHLRVAQDLGADAAALASSALAIAARGPFWVELGAWPDYSLGADGKDDLGRGDDVPVIRGQLRLTLYLALPSAGASLALLLVAALLAARLLPLEGRPGVELVVSIPLAVVALAGAALMRQLLPLDPLEELWGARHELEQEQLVGGWRALLSVPPAPVLGSALVALWVLVALLRLRWTRPAPPTATLPPG